MLQIYLRAKSCNRVTTAAPREIYSRIVQIELIKYKLLCDFSSFISCALLIYWGISCSVCLSVCLFVLIFAVFCLCDEWTFYIKCSVLMACGIWCVCRSTFIEHQKKVWHTILPKTSSELCSNASAFVSQYWIEIKCSMKHFKIHFYRVIDLIVC